MKRETKEFLRMHRVVFVIISVLLISTIGLGIANHFIVKDAEEKIAKIKEDYNKSIEEMEQLKEDALTAIENGYAIYCNGIKVDRDDVIIESLLEFNTVVRISHEEKYVELKN